MMKQPSKRLILAMLVALLGLCAASCATDESTDADEPNARSGSSQESLTVPSAAFDMLAEADLEKTELTESQSVLTVDAELDGVRGTFVVDTTASHHVVTREFAESHGIVFSEPTDTVSGEAARRGAPVSAVETTTLELGGDRIEMEDMLALPREAVFPELPQVERTSTLAGVISPQNLYRAKQRYTTLNLDENKLLAFEAQPSGVKAWLTVKFGAQDIESVERMDGMTPELPKVVATLNGGAAEEVLLLDSTAKRSILRATTAGVADQEMNCLVQGTNGCELDGVIADAQTVAFGGLESPEFTAVGTTSTLDKPGIDGVLGRDAMQHFVWVFPADDDESMTVAQID